MVTVPILASSAVEKACMDLFSTLREQSDWLKVQMPFKCVPFSQKVQDPHNILALTPQSVRPALTGRPRSRCGPRDWVFLTRRQDHFKVNLAGAATQIALRQTRVGSRARHILGNTSWRCHPCRRAREKKRQGWECEMNWIQLWKYRL